MRKLINTLRIIPLILAITYNCSAQNIQIGLRSGFNNYYVSNPGSIDAIKTPKTGQEHTSIINTLYIRTEIAKRLAIELGTSHTKIKSKSVDDERYALDGNQLYDWSILKATDNIATLNTSLQYKIYESSAGNNNKFACYLGLLYTHHIVKTNIVVQNQLKNSKQFIYDKLAGTYSENYVGPIFNFSYCISSRITCTSILSYNHDISRLSISIPSGQNFEYEYFPNAYLSCQLGIGYSLW